MISWRRFDLDLIYFGSRLLSHQVTKKHCGSRRLEFRDNAPGKVDDPFGVVNPDGAMQPDIRGVTRTMGSDLEKSALGRRQYGLLRRACRSRQQ